MTSLLSRIATLIRVWLGLSDPMDEAMTPAHGWLLPAPGALRMVRAVVPVVNGSGR